MGLILENPNIFIIITGSLIGSLKANLDSPSSINKPMFHRIVDIALGVFCGVALGSHYTINLSVWFAGLLSLVAGSVGANILDVIRELTPSISRKLIRDYFSKNKTN